MLVAVLTGLISFPRERTIERTLQDWLPENPATSTAQKEELLSAFQAFEDGRHQDVASISEREFRSLGLPATLAFLDTDSSTRDFVLRFVGKQGQRLFVAERKVAAAPWWSPDRWAYKALEAEADQLGNVLRLTYERDLTGLVAVLLLDLVVGSVYAAVIGLILAVLGLEGIENKHQRKLPRALPIPAPISRDVFRA